MVTINSGAPEPTDKFEDTPRSKWKTLLNVKRSFLSRRLKHDCRCLIDFCEEAELVYAELGFASAEEMIREGYELDPSQIELAVAWLKSNGTEKPIGLDDIGRKIAEAKAAPLPTQEIGVDGGKPGPGRGKKTDDIVSRLNYGNDTEYTLRRLARDCPQMLDKIEAGELSVNAAAIQAGIRKKPKPEEVCVKAFRKTDNRLEAIKMIVSELKDHERQMLIEILQGATP